MPTRRFSTLTLFLLAAILALAAATVPPRPARAQIPDPGSRYYPQTGHTVKRAFRAYWDEHGALAQQGYPLSDEFLEKSDLDGQTYAVQYFERAVFEWHAAAFAVQLAQLGTYRYRARYGAAGAPGQVPNQTAGHARFFGETGHWVGGGFWDYWQAHGGLEQQGYPLSDEFAEQSSDGRVYTVQYFERAVFEYHPENRGTPYVILLALLGSQRLTTKYPAGPPPGALVPFPAARRLNRITMLSPSEGWAVGAGILHYSGGRWSLVSPPDADESLTDVAMVSSTEGWAVGLGQILHYTGGQWWPDPFPVYAPLFGIQMLSPTDGWAVGYDHGASGAILHYSGGQWRLVTDTPALLALDMLSPSEGWAVGAGIYHYSGGRWSLVKGTEDYLLSAVKMVSAQEGWAADSSGTLYHYQNGVWRVAGPSAAGVLGFSGLTATDGWAVGAAPGSDGNATILRYQHGQWGLAAQFPGTERLQDVALVSPTVGWAVGNDGSILHYQNGAWAAYRP